MKKNIFLFSYTLFTIVTVKIKLLAPKCILGTIKWFPIVVQRKFFFFFFNLTNFLLRWTDEIETVLFICCDCYIIFLYWIYNIKLICIEDIYNDACIHIMCLCANSFLETEKILLSFSFFFFKKKVNVHINKFLASTCD